MSRLDPAALGEHGFLRALRRRAKSAGSAWREGIGDDAAILKARAGFETVVTTDSLVEDVHFRWRHSDARQIGRKALRVSLADIGAMGAEPIGCLLNLSLPEGASAERLEGFFAGFLGEARRSSCPLVGGDTVRAGEWNLGVTVFGRVRRGRALLRSAARAGDRILLSGSLGHAALGLQFLELDGERPALAAPFVAQQQCPRVPWLLGSRLSASPWAAAAIDLSDGLLADLGHICDRSGVGADLDLRALQGSRRFNVACAAVGADATALILGGGEDYSLLFTVRAGAPDRRAIARRIGASVREIGVVRRGSGIRVFDGDSRVCLAGKGFDHFKSP